MVSASCQLFCTKTGCSDCQVSRLKLKRYAPGCYEPLSPRHFQILLKSEKLFCTSYYYARTKLGSQIIIPEVPMFLLNNQTKMVASSTFDLFRQGMTLIEGESDRLKGVRVFCFRKDNFTSFLAWCLELDEIEQFSKFLEGYNVIQPFFEQSVELQTYIVHMYLKTLCKK